MMLPYTPEMKTLLRLLGDGQWHAYSEIKDRLAATIGAGKALRKYEDRLEKRRSRGGHTAMPVEPDEDEKIFYGQRLIADVTLQTAKKNWIEIDNEGGGFGRRMIRLQPDAKIPETKPPGTEIYEPEAARESRPELPRASVLPEAVLTEVAAALSGQPKRRRVQEDDRAAPRAPEPSQRATKDEMALFSENEVRRIISEEVGRQLDAFQAGFQIWLAERLEEIRELVGRGSHQRIPWQ